MFQRIIRLAKSLIGGESARKCQYCEGQASKTLVWLFDKQGRPANIRLPWCGCDLMTALRRFWNNPYQVREGIDYRFEAGVTDLTVRAR